MVADSRRLLAVWLGVNFNDHVGVCLSRKTLFDILDLKLNKYNKLF